MSVIRVRFIAFISFICANVLFLGKNLGCTRLTATLLSEAKAIEHHGDGAYASWRLPLS